jgi:hypothetical protein
MLVGYVRISTSDDRQSTDLQSDALLSAGLMNEISMRIRHRVPVTTGRGLSYAWSSSALGTS